MITVGTDCTGIGSPEQALINLKTPHVVKFACEKDSFARKSYLENYPCELMFDDVTTRDHSKTPYVDLYIAGFPCQAFSLIGERLGFEDIRGTVFFHCAEYIKLHQPKVFVFENVRGLVSHDKGRTFQTILNVLGSTVNGQQQLPFYMDHLDYNVYFKILNTVDYGLPQNRERVFVVGVRKDQPGFSFPKPQPLEFELKDYLEPEVDERFFLSETAMKRLALMPDNEETTIVVNDKGVISNRDVFNCIDANYAKGMDNHGQRSLLFIKSGNKRGFDVATDFSSVDISGRFQKTARGVVKKNCHTITAGGNNGVVLQGRLRRLTPRECFRLQGFPDSFKFVVSETQLYKQAGNSISVPVIQSILQNIRFTNDK